MESESSVWLVTKASLTLAGSPAWVTTPAQTSSASEHPIALGRRTHGPSA